MSDTANSPVVPPLIHRATWHSPIPYLFGGLAAMLGLIAFALLILACSYWKLSGYLDENTSSNHDVEMGEDTNPEEIQKAAVVYEENSILVIMAGQALPTFLATPVIKRASLGDCGSDTGNFDKGQTNTTEIQNIRAG